MKTGNPYLTRSLFLVFRFELMLLMSSITLPLFLGGFLCFLSMAIFLIGDFLNTNLTTLDVQWQFLPWISIIFIPAFAMNAFNRQIHSGGQDLELSYPLSELTIVSGKWLSGIAVFVAMLMLTFPIVLTLEFLGNPDWGLIFAGYLGAFLMICLLYSIALYSAAIARDQIGSFLLGAGIIFLLILSDLQFLQSSSMPKGVKMLAGQLYLVSPKHWLDEIASGRIDFAGISYFVLFTFFVIISTGRQVKTFREPSKKPFFSTSISFLQFLLACLVSSYASSLLGERSLFIDVTEYKEFNLQPETLQLAAGSPEIIEATLYVSEDLSTVPKVIIQHMARVSNMLKALSRSSNGKFIFLTQRLDPDTVEADNAEMFGIRNLPMSSGDILFFGAGFKSADRHLAIDYFDISRAGVLEYEIALKISNLSKKSAPKVSIISSLFKPSNVLESHPTISIIDELKTQYDVEILPYFSDRVTETDILIIVDTPILKREMLRSIDQHITEGKPTLILLDPHQRMNQKNSSLNTSASKKGELNSLIDLLAAYGINFSVGNVVGDLDNAATVQTQTGHQYLYPYWLRFGPQNLSSSNPVTANLNELYFPEPGFFSIDDSGPMFEPLILTGRRAGQVSSTTVKEKDTEYLAKTFTPRQSKPLNIAIYVTGKVRSAFDNTYRSRSHTALMLVADVDWIYDVFSQSRPKSAISSNDNVPLFMNIVEYLSGDPNLLTIRSNGNPVRRFEAVEDLLVEGQRKHQSLEMQYLEKIRESESVIAEVLSMAKVDTIDELPDELAKQAREFKAKIYPMKQQLRQIRGEMRSDINTLFIRITVLNLIAGPILVILLYLLARRTSFFRYQNT